MLIKFQCYKNSVLIYWSIKTGERRLWFCKIYLLSYPLKDLKKLLKKLLETKVTNVLTHTNCFTDIWNDLHTSRSAVYAKAACSFSPLRTVRTGQTTARNETSVFTHGRRETDISRRSSNQPQRWKHARTTRRGFQQRPNFKTQSSILLHFPRWENCRVLLFPGL